MSPLHGSHWSVHQILAMSMFITFFLVDLVFVFVTEISTVLFTSLLISLSDMTTYAYEILKRNPDDRIILEDEVFLVRKKGFPKKEACQH